MSPAPKKIIRSPSSKFSSAKSFKLSKSLYALTSLCPDDINEEIGSNFYSFLECVHSPLTDSHFRDPIPRRRKIDFEGRRREYGISECVQGIFVVHRSSTDKIGHNFMCKC